MFNTSTASIDLAKQLQGNKFIKFVQYNRKMSFFMDNKMMWVSLEDLKKILGNRFSADGGWFQVSAGSGLKGFKGILDNDQPHYPFEQGAEYTGTGQER